MPIVFQSPLKSSVANATFFDKTVDDKTIAKMGLEDASGDSGADITNAQLAINTSTKLVNAEQVKDNGGTITLDAISNNQEFRLTGLAGAITMDVLPFSGAKVVADGTIISLVGHSDTNTVTFSHNDVDFGLLINGDATLLRGNTLILNYNDELKRYIEVGRNF